MAVQVPSPIAGAPIAGARVAGARIAGILVIGAVVVVDPAGLAPFGPAKWMAISTLGFATVAAAAWWGRNALHRPSLVLWAVLIGFLGLGVLFGGDVPTALIGQPDRHLGLITWVLFALLFFTGQQITGQQITGQQITGPQITGTDGRRSVIRSAVLAALLLGCWCAWELVAGRPIDLDTNSRRLTGPFGSAAYLGAASTLLLPIALAMAIDRSTDGRWRVIAAIASVGATIGLIGSGSRAAWVGTSIALVVTVVAVRPAPRRLLPVAAVIGIALLLVAPRLSDAADRSAGPSSRLDEWAMATRVVIAHPVVGVGPEGYRIAVSEGVDRAYEIQYGRDRVLPDRAHSGPLDVALAGGLPASVAFMSLVAFICWRAATLMRHRRGLAGLCAGVIGYTAQQLLLFPLAELDPIWWLFAGMVVAASPSPQLTNRATLRRIAAMACALGATVALGLGVLDVAADRLAARSLDDINGNGNGNGNGNIDIAVSSAERAVALRPDVIRYRMVAAVLLAERGTLADIDAAIGQADAALRWSNHDPIALDRHASLLLDRAVVTGDAADTDAAVDAWTELVERDPLRARWQLQLGRAAVLGGDTSTARVAWTAAATLSPDDLTAARLLAEI